MQTVEDVLRSLCGHADGTFCGQCRIVGAEQHAVKVQERGVLGRDFSFEHIQTRTAEPSFPQGTHQSGLVHGFAARAVDEERAGFQGGKGSPAHNVSGFLCIGNVQRYRVGPPERLK